MKVQNMPQFSPHMKESSCGHGKKYMLAFISSQCAYKNIFLYPRNFHTKLFPTKQNYFEHGKFKLYELRDNVYKKRKLIE